MSSSEPSPAAPSLGVNLGWALASLLRTYQKQVDTALAGLPGGSRAFLVMLLVKRETCQSQAIIAERLGLDKTNLTYLLDGLEQAHLVKRVTDPNDRRSRHINLTEQGTQSLAGLVAAVEAVERDVLSRLSPEEAAHFQALLGKTVGIAGAHPAGKPDDIEICKASIGSAEAC